MSQSQSDHAADHQTEEQRTAEHDRPSCSTLGCGLPATETGLCELCQGVEEDEAERWGGCCRACGGLCGDEPTCPQCGAEQVSPEEYDAAFARIEAWWQHQDAAWRNGGPFAA